MTAAAVWVLLLWHGGLHPWQQAAAALFLALLIVKERAKIPQWRGLDSTERILWVLLGLAACGVFLSLRPQNTLNAAAGLVLVLGASMLMRRDRDLSVEGLARLFKFGGASFAAAFLGCGLAAWMFHGDAGAVNVARWFFPNQNLLAAGLILPSLLLGLAGLAKSENKSRFSDGLALVLGVLALVYAGSRAAYVCWIAASMWLLLRWPGTRRRLAPALVLMFMGGAALTLWSPFSRLAERAQEQATPGQSDDNYYRRADFWKGALKLSLKRPGLGYGMDSFGAAAYGLDLPTALTPREPVARYRLTLDHAHNEWLEFTVEMGWPITLVLAACVLAWCGRRLRRGSRDADSLGLEAVLVAAGTLSLVDMNLRTPALGWGLVLCFCALEKISEAPARQEQRGDSRGTGTLLAVAALAVFCLLGAAIGHAYIKDQKARAGTATEAWAALCLQPFDAGIADTAQRQGLAPWPWTAWAGRANPSWWWDQAVLTSGGAMQEADALHATSLRPYFAPGWYWLGLKQVQNGEPTQAARSMAEALRLEPNFCRVLAWEASMASAHGDKIGQRRLLRRIESVEAMKPYTVDDYVRYIQTVDAPQKITAIAEAGP